MKKGIFQKTLILVIVLSLIPFIFINIYYYFQLKDISKFAINRSKEGFDKKSIKSLTNQATYVADRISEFLKSCVNDVYDISLIELSKDSFLKFSQEHIRNVFIRQPTFLDNYFLTEKKIPTYKKILYIAPNGRVLINIQDNCLTDNENLENLVRKIFIKKIKYLKDNEIYFSHLIGYYVTKKKALSGAESPENAIGGKQYRGFYIIARKINGNYILLCLDYRHIAEFVMHLFPNSTKFIEYPIYSSGNYAFLVDDEGWTIAHPKIWDIRGYDKDGKLVPAYTVNTPERLIKEGKIPFNLSTASFIHKNYPIVLKNLQKRKSGCVNTTNIGGVNKVMAYAPIMFSISEYSKYKIFGGVTIGAKVFDFHKDAIVTQKIINKKFYIIKNKIVVTTFIIIFLIILGSFIFTSQITSPIIVLSRRFTELGKGNLKNVKVDFKRSDEIGIMGKEFNHMVDMILEKNRKLSNTINEIKNERNFINNIFKSMINGLIYIDNRGYITHINDMAKSMFNINDNIIGKKFKEVFAYLPKLVEFYNDTVSEKEFMVYEIEFNDKIFGCSSKFVEDHQGIIMIFRDITEKRLTDEHLKKVDRFISMGRVAAGIAHEIRNPLTGINLLLEDLYDNLEGEDRELIRKALNEIVRLENIVSELLDYASPMREKFNYYNLVDIIESSVFFIKKQAKEKGIDITKEYYYTGDLYCSIEKIKQAFINILLNSIDAIKSKGWIIIKTFFEDNNVVVIFEDNGEGIKDEDIKYVFDPFFTTKKQGTGLGLSITQNILFEHNATIDIETETGKGTKFIIKFKQKREIIK